jgi:hypothetical protein
MGYRIEFLAVDSGSNEFRTCFEDIRFPTFFHAIAAARTRADRLVAERSASVMVSIFDRHDRLASKLQLAISGGP